MVISINIVLLCSITMILLVILCVLFIGLYVRLKYKYKEIQGKYYIAKKSCLHTSNLFSMIEYHYKRFKEGINPYTVLRDIGDVITNSSGDD